MTDVQFAARVLIHVWERIAFVYESMIQVLGGDDKIPHSDVDFHGDNGNLHDDVRSVQESVNDDRFSHSDDESEENDEEGNGMTMSDGDDGIRNVRICDESHDGGGWTVNGDDESGDQSDDDNRGRRFQGKCF